MMEGRKKTGVMDAFRQLNLCRNNYISDNEYSRFGGWDQDYQDVRPAFFSARVAGKHAWTTRRPRGRVDVLELSLLLIRRRRKWQFMLPRIPVSVSQVQYFGRSVRFKPSGRR